MLMLGLLLLTATAGLPLAVIYWYKTYVSKQGYAWYRNDILIPLIAAVVQFLASTVPYHFLSQTAGNFLHHAIGGGVAVAIMTMYVLHRLKPALPIWQQLLVLFSTVNILGNINEIVELLAEVTTNRIYIVSKFDTNIDLVANNSGVLIGFLVIFGLLKLARLSRR